VLTGGRWFLIVGLVFYSLMTTTPFVQAHSEWQWSGWVLGLIVDAAFIMALSAEGTLAKHGVTKLGAWPTAFRWATGLSSVFLNVWLSIERRDWVGVAVHLIAPLLVMLLAEVGPIYMAALAEAEREALSAPEKPAEPAPVAPEPEPVPEPEKAPEPVQDELPEPEPEPEPEPVADDEPKRLPNAEANKIIEQGWRHKLNPIEVAAAAGRHPATVRKKFAQLDAELTV
jgi:outer membrane biosynthesis protein TonB